MSSLCGSEDDGEALRCRQFNEADSFGVHLQAIDPDLQIPECWKVFVRRGWYNAAERAFAT